jgi:DNA-binding LacI/PurR family transcriptional regulator
VDIGRTAVDYLLSAFTGSTRRRAVLLPYRLIIRGSAGVPHNIPFPIAAPS